MFIVDTYSDDKVTTFLSNMQIHFVIVVFLFMPMYG